MHDAPFMLRAIELAMRGRGAAEPNPCVGCVIEKNGRVIGEGFHARFGGPHAEAAALAACTESPAGATTHVTLEPCCHTNKKTPPCAPALIAAKVARVVIGCIDPNPAVAGKGVAMLREAKIAVVQSPLENQCRQLIAPYIKMRTQRRPYVTLKWAQSADGKVAGPGGRPVRIGNDAAGAAVHNLRRRCDAILVGVNTLLNDDPLLTARPPGERRLLRCVLDTHGRTPATSRLVQSVAEDVVIFTAKDRNDLSVPVVRVPTNASGHVSLPHVLDTLGGMLEGFGPHLLIEPGPTLANAFIKQNLADRVWIIRSPRRIEDATAPAAAAVDWPSTKTVNLGGDELTEYLNPAGPAFFALEPSADLLMAANGQ